MSGIELGVKPEYMRLVLTPKTDFWAECTYEDDAGNPIPYPANASLTLEFDKGAAPWFATITDSAAVFSEPPAVVDALIALRPKRVLMLLVQDGKRQPWYKGDVQWT